MMAHLLLGDDLAIQECLLEFVSPLPYLVSLGIVGESCDNQLWMVNEGKSARQIMDTHDRRPPYRAWASL